MFRKLTEQFVRLAHAGFVTVMRTILLWVFSLTSYASGQTVPHPGRPLNPAGPASPTHPSHLPHGGGGSSLDAIILYTLVIFAALSILGGILFSIFVALGKLMDRSRDDRLRRLGIPTHKDIFSHKGMRHRGRR